MPKKSQLATFDMILSLSIFVIVFGFLIMFFRTNTKNLELNQEYYILEKNANFIAETLVKNTGYPPNWQDNVASPDIIGLSSRDRVISQNKFNSFLNMNYSNAKDIFNIPYEYYFQLSYANGTLIGKSGNQENLTKVVAVKRIVYYENESAILLFELKK